MVTELICMLAMYGARRRPEIGIAQASLAQDHSWSSQTSTCQTYNIGGWLLPSLVLGITQMGGKDWLAQYQDYVAQWVIG